VRRALLKSWPALTEFYGGAITPQSVEWMTADELNAYINYRNERVKAHNEAIKKKR
jgi:hypothetical protein